jgi:hypothetical protein
VESIRAVGLAGNNDDSNTNVAEGGGYVEYTYLYQVYRYKGIQDLDVGFGGLKGKKLPGQA